MTSVISFASLALDLPMMFRLLREYDSGSSRGRGGYELLLSDPAAGDHVYLRSQSSLSAFKFNPCVMSPAAFVENHAPCILLIEDLDFALYDDTWTAHGGGGGVGPAQGTDDSPAARLATALRKFLNDLWAAVAATTLADAKSEKKKVGCRSTGGTFATSTVLVAAATSSLEKLSPILRALFPTSVQLPGLQEDEESQLFADYLVSSYSTAATGGTHGVVDALKKVVADQSTGGGAPAGASLSVIMDAASEAALCALHENRGSLWLEEVGLTNACGVTYKQQTVTTTTASSSSSSPSSSSSLPSSLTLSITVDAVNKSRSYRPLPPRSKKGATVAPVHWEDIGGLDRFVGLSGFVPVLWHCTSSDVASWTSSFPLYTD